MVEKYVQGFPELQEALVRQLDVFCEQGYDINAYLRYVCIRSGYVFVLSRFDDL